MRKYEKLKIPEIPEFQNKISKNLGIVEFKMSKFKNSK